MPSVAGVFGSPGMRFEIVTRFESVGIEQLAIAKLMVSLEPHGTVATEVDQDWVVSTINSSPAVRSSCWSRDGLS
jgi:hypothetical protein